MATLEDATGMQQGPRDSDLQFRDYLTHRQSVNFPSQSFKGFRKTVPPPPFLNRSEKGCCGGVQPRALIWLSLTDGVTWILFLGLSVLSCNLVW